MPTSTTALKSRPNPSFLSVFSLVTLLLLSPVALAQLELDERFGQDGRVVTPIESFTSETALALVTDEMNRFYSGFSGTNSGVARHDANGNLDPTFGTGGATSLDFFVTDIALQGDGKIIAVGARRAGPLLASQDWRIARLRPDGTPDPAFGDNGTLTIDFEGETDSAQTVAIDGNGRIVVGGAAFLPGQGTAFALAILTPDGTLEATRVFKLFSDTADFCEAVLIQPDGKIICAGLARNFGNAVMAAIRLDVNLELDEGFGTNGLGVVAFDQDPAEANDALLLADGSIVLGGFVERPGRDRNLALARLTATGSIDTDFGMDGRFERALTGDESEVIEALLFHEGMVYAAAAVAQSSADAGRFVALKVSPLGLADNSFGNGGLAIAEFRGGADVARTIALQEGAILLGGGVSGARATEGSNIGLARFETSGDLDLGFNSDGQNEVSLQGQVNARGRAVAHQPDGKIVMAGFVGTSFSDRSVVLTRYLDTGALDPAFGNDGIVVTDLAEGEDTAAAIRLQPDGKVLVAGSFRVPPATSNDFGIARYLANGSLDPGFGQNGVVVLDIGGRADDARALMLQDDGRILIVGDGDFPNQAFSQNLVVVRLEASGDVDTAFGLNGVANVSIGDFDEGRAIGLLGDGSILVGGTGDRDFAIARFTSSGVLDPSFGTNGVTTYDFAGSFDFLTDLLVIPDWNGAGERILAVGTARESSAVSSTQFAAALFTRDGNLENGFGDQGVALLDIAPGQAENGAAAAILNNTIILAGDVQIDAKRRFAVTGLTLDGVPDPGFSPDGATLLFSFFGESDVGQAISVSPSGEVVIAGEAFDRSKLNGGLLFALARLAVSDVLLRDGFEAPDP